MREKPMDSWRTNAAVSEALDVFNSSYMQEVWNKAIARRQMDPDGAVTSARQLLESVCKHILTDSQKPFKDNLSLPDLYKLAAGELHIAPSEHTAPIFSSLFSACAEIVQSIGRLRNHLSDAHGHGPFGSMPDWRHAELAVNLSAAMATYLAAVWAGRQPTVGDVIEKFIADSEVTKPLGLSHRYTLETIMASPISSVIASKVEAADVLAHWHSRRSKNIAPATIMHDVTYLRGALGGASEDAIYEAIQILNAQNETRRYVPRERRVTDEEFQALSSLFKEPPKKPRKNLIARMHEFMEFALWSGRTQDELCNLRWEDVDFEQKTCKVPGTNESFPLLEKAWEIVEMLKPATGKTGQIFPYAPKSAGAKFMLAKKALRARLGDEWGKDLTFNDFRYEAVCRLLEKKHPPHVVASATGQAFEKVALIHRKLESPDEPDFQENEDSSKKDGRRRRRRVLRAS